MVLTFGIIHRITADQIPGYHNSIQRDLCHVLESVARKFTQALLMRPQRGIMEIKDDAWQDFSA